jgi:hypothetical protein
MTIDIVSSAPVVGQTPAGTPAGAPPAAYAANLLGGGSGGGGEMVAGQALHGSSAVLPASAAPAAAAPAAGLPVQPASSAALGAGGSVQLLDAGSAQQLASGQRLMSMQPWSTISSNSSYAGAPKELRTVFLVGFPSDTKIRELHNLLKFLPGYEACQVGSRQALQHACVASCQAVLR